MQATISYLINLTDQPVLFRNNDREIHTYVASNNPILHFYASPLLQVCDPAAVVCYKTQFEYLSQPLFHLLNKVPATSVGVH